MSHPRPVARPPKPSLSPGLLRTVAVLLLLELGVGLVLYCARG